IAFRVTFCEHLFQNAEAVVAHDRVPARVSALLDEMTSKGLEIVTIHRDVLAGVIAVPLDELRHLRLLASVDTLDQRDAEVAVVDAPDLHAAVRIVRANVIDTVDQGTALHLDMKPRPLLDHAGSAGVSDVIDLSQKRHGEPPYRVV